MADGAQDKPGVRPKSADKAGIPDERTWWGQFRRGFDEPEANVGQTRLQSMIANSVFNPKGYEELFKGDQTVDLIENGQVVGRNVIKDLSPQAKASYVAGRLAHDVLTDGTRVPYWALNHPLAIAGVLGEEASGLAGLSPDYATIERELERKNLPAGKHAIDMEFSRRMGLYHGGEGVGAPLTAARFMLPAMATGALTHLAGNTDYLNLLGGGRPAGYAAVLPSEGDKTVSTNPIAELAARYVLGRTGRLLPWEEFTHERPDVSYDDYRAAATHQFDKGFLGLGLVRGTSRNLEGEPEGTLMGFRVPFSAATGALGTLAGGVAGAHALTPVIEQHLAKRHQVFRAPGHQRMAGAAIGALLGGMAGNLGGKAVNAVVIQPALNPERVQQAEAWARMTPAERAVYVTQRQREIEDWKAGKQQQAIEAGIV